MRCRADVGEDLLHVGRQHVVAAVEERGDARQREHVLVRARREPEHDQLAQRPASPTSAGCARRAPEPDDVFAESCRRRSTVLLNESPDRDDVPTASPDAPA